MSRNIEEITSFIMNELAKGARGWVLLDQKELELVKIKLQKLSSGELSSNDIKSLLCIISHSRKAFSEFNEDLEKYLKKGIKNSNELNDILNALTRHYLATHHSMGKKFSGDFLLAVRELFRLKDIDSKILLLEFIDELGNQKLFFKHEVKAIFKSIKIWQQFSQKKNYCKLRSIELLKEMDKLMGR